MSLKNIIELMKNAVHSEIDSQGFYQEAVKCTKRDEAKKMFKRLIDDEKRHERILTERYTGLTKDPLPSMEPHKKRIDMARKIVKGRTTEVDALKIAINKERWTHNNYLEMADNVKDKDLEDVLQLLAQDELGHEQILVAEYRAFTNQPFDEYELDLYVRE